MSEDQRMAGDLPDSVERLKAILDAAVEAILTIDERGRIESANPATERLFGFSAAEMIGQNVSMLMPSPDREQHDRYLTTYLRTGEAKIIGIGREVICQRRDGSLFPADLSVSETQLASRRIFTGILRDITERKRAERELEESRARLEGIVESAMDAIITIDDEQRVVLFNAAAEKMLGCVQGEALGSRIERFIPARFRKAHAEHVRKFGETGTTSRAMGTLGALSAVRDSGEEFPIEASISQVEVNGRKLFTVILRDVTERTRAEVAAKVRTQQQAAVADLSQHALSGRDLDRLMNDAVALLAQVLGIEYAKLLELTPAGDQLFLRAGVGWREGWIGSRRVPADRDSQAAYTLLSNAPVVVEDLATEVRFRPAPLLVEHGVVSGMSVIIRGRWRPYGVLGAHTTTRRTFNGDDLHFLQSIADVLAAAIERRQLEEELLAATGREQRRIGQDLHDGLCQHLAGLEFRVEALARDLTSQPAAHEEAEKIGALLREGTRQARMLARGLSPVELETNGLMSALSELAANSVHLYRINCQFFCAEPVLVTNEAAATHLYRIAQEAISNAVRHARAKSIAIALRGVGDEAVLTVTNDGPPLPADPGRGGGMGLRIMRYRAEMIGATLRLSSTEDGLVHLIDREPDLVVAWQAENAAQALQTAVNEEPDLALVDITLPDKGGIDLIKDLKAVRPEMKVLVVSMHEESLYAERALRAGARGYISKQEGGAKLMLAIRQVLTGQMYVSEKTAARIVEIFSGQSAASTQSPVAQLSDREFEVFQLIGQGLSTQEIGDRMSISAKTVEAHRVNIKTKLSLTTTAELISFAARWTASGGDLSGSH